MRHFVSPPGYHRIKVVNSFHELVSTPLDQGVNALCWQRTLPGDFSEIVAQLVVSEDITALDAERLNALPVSAAGRIAVLSRYLGHARVTDTYWYLSATPELLAAAARNFKTPRHEDF